MTETTILRTYKRLYECVNAANKYFSVYAGADNKLLHALKKFGKINQQIIDDYADETLSKKIKYASIDPQKNLVKTGNDYAYTKENQLALNKEMKELNLKEVEVKPFLIAADEVPTDLPFAFRDAFLDFIIPAAEPPDDNPA